MILRLVLDFHVNTPSIYYFSYDERTKALSEYPMIFSFHHRYLVWPNQLNDHKIFFGSKTAQFSPRSIGARLIVQPIGTVHRDKD